MERREALSVLGAAVAGMAALAARPPTTEAAEHMHAAHFAACAKECAACLTACESCFRHCATLVADGRRDHVAAMNLCADCADLCAAAARISGRQGPLTVAACDACAKACDACGAECAKFPRDTHLAACAKACRDCAQACRQMIQHLKA